MITTNHLLTNNPNAQQAGQAGDNGGLRYNEGKARFDLLPPDGLEALAEVYAKGAAKYAERNWERGMAWSKCFASLMRHAWAWMRGEHTDPETGMDHMVHVAWNALALVVYAKRKIGTDDRPGSSMVLPERLQQ